MAAASVPPDFASPKSRTFTQPSGRILTFAGFRSRFTMPFSRAAFQASAQSVSRSQGLIRAESHPARSDPPGSGLRSTHYQVVRPNVVRRADIGMVQRRNRTSFAFAVNGDNLAPFLLDNKLCHRSPPVALRCTPVPKSWKTVIAVCLREAGEQRTCADRPLDE